MKVGAPLTLLALAGVFYTVNFAAAADLGERPGVELVDWSGRIARPGKRGRIAASAPATVRRLGHSGLQWKFQLLGIESRYWRAVGAADALLEKAAAMGQCWLKGQGIGRRLMRAHT